MLKSKTPKLLAVAALLTAGATTLHAQVNAEVDINNRYTSVVPDNTKVYKSKRPPVEERLFISTAVEKKIKEVQQLLSGNPRLAWMFANCFPNTLESTVHYRVIDGEDDTFVYTGDIPAMWLRDSGAQVWPYVQLANDDPRLKKMLRGVILRQLKCINIDRYANASQWLRMVHMRVSPFSMRCSFSRKPARSSGVMRRVNSSMCMPSLGISWP